VVAELSAEAPGTIAWSAADGAAVRAGARLGTLRAERSVPATPTAAQRKKLQDLEKLAAVDPVYVEFLERERARLRRASRTVVTRLPIVAPADGRLLRVAAERARVTAGAPLAHLADGTALHLEVALPGHPPALDATCELSGDVPGQVVPCRLVEARLVDGGTALVVAASTAEAPWLDEARSPSVRIAPPGTAAAPPALAPPAPAPPRQETARP
jgi:hypothetical protein